MSGGLLIDEGMVMLWGLQLRRPGGWWVEVPDTCREHQGEILLKAPRGITVAVAWGRLGHARQRFPVPATHMDASLRRLGANAEDSRLVVLYRKPLEVHGHAAEVASVEILPVGGWLGRSRQAMASVVHCPQRDRFYSIYTHPYPASDQAVEQAFHRVLKDFCCH